jgi:hypothetical protein
MKRVWRVLMASDFGGVSFHATRPSYDCVMSRSLTSVHCSTDYYINTIRSAKKKKKKNLFILSMVIVREGGGGWTAQVEGYVN